MPVITISRQFGSGGSDIAKRVADQLTWPLIDNEFVDRVAERAGVSAAEVEKREERVPRFVERLAQALAISSPEVFVATGETPEPGFGSEGALVRATEAVINQAVQEEKLLIVGRGAQAYLAHRTDALHVYVVAPRGARVQAVVDRLALSRKDAEEKVDQVDRYRRRYVKTHYQRVWDDPTNYDLVLNSDALGYAGCAKLIVAAAEQRGWR